MPNSYLLGDGGLREALLAECYDLLVVSQALLSFCLTECNALRQHMRRLLPLRSLNGRGSCCLAFPMHGEMTCQYPLQSLSKVFEQMEPICGLRCSGNRTPSSGGVVSSSISTQ